MHDMMHDILLQSDLDSVFPGGQPTVQGQGIGIIAIDLTYPKLPGNVVNASTFDFPVIYTTVAFEIEQLFAGDPSIRQSVIDAALSLEAKGVRAVIGACGYFAHFQKDVAAALTVPAYMSSLLQLPLISASLGPKKSVLVLAADGESLTPDVLASMGTSDISVVVQDIGHLKSFAPIRFGNGAPLDNDALTRELIATVEAALLRHPECGAILLECSDLPPYAWAIQRASKLPVYDFITLIRWVWSAVAQRPYFGII